tara:strand:- start:14142 stop:14402 length:261 start_codon:yes stop_codon:yes gene_type:complete
MAVNRRIASVIRRWDNADFNEHKYTIVYASRDSEAIINGEEVFLVATTQLDFNVSSISANTNNVYVLGDNSNVVEGTATLSHYPNP